MYVYTIYTWPRWFQAQYSRSCPINSIPCYNGSLVTWTWSISFNCHGSVSQPTFVNVLQLIRRVSKKSAAVNAVSAPALNSGDSGFKSWSWHFWACNEEFCEVTGDWRKLHNEELHNLYSSPNIIRMIKSRRMRWTEHLARIGKRGMHLGYWWGSQ
jgi:hypothetical protein